MIVLLSINYGLNESAGLFPFFLKHGNYDVHDLRNERWEARKNSLNYALCHLLKHKVNILQQIKSGLSKLLHLRLNQIDEDVD